MKKQDGGTREVERRRGCENNKLAPVYEPFEILIVQSTRGCTMFDRAGVIARVIARFLNNHKPSRRFEIPREARKHLP